MSYIRNNRMLLSLSIFQPAISIRQNGFKIDTIIVHITDRKKCSRQLRDSFESWIFSVFDLNE